jgi:hypothetical protein
VFSPLLLRCRVVWCDSVPFPRGVVWFCLAPLVVRTGRRKTNLTYGSSSLRVPYMNLEWSAGSWTCLSLFLQPAAAHVAAVADAAAVAAALAAIADGVVSVRAVLQCQRRLSCLRMPSRTLLPRWLPMNILCASFVMRSNCLCCCCRFRRLCWCWCCLRY